MASIPEPAVPLPPLEAAKRRAAFRAIADHFSSANRFTGIGSGSTIIYGIEAIKHHLTTHPPPPNHMNWFVPTGWNSRKAIEAAGLAPLVFDSLPADAVLDVCFDGADEVDADLNLIKGGGACLFQEKLVAARSRKFVAIADHRKAAARLLTQWPSIPIEVAPLAAAAVARELRRLGSSDPKLREHVEGRTGPVLTDQSFYIIDAVFPALVTGEDVRAGKKGDGSEGGVWEVVALAERIKAIVGVLEVGLFCGVDGVEAKGLGMDGGQKPVAVYFGMQDGSVEVRERKA